MKKISHDQCMRILCLLLLLPTLLFSEESLPDMADLVIPNLKAMPTPEMRTFEGGIQMAITTSSPEAQQRVLQGLNLIHGGWDFEAYRQFMEAVKLDPECLMANFGVAFSLAGADSEFSKARLTAATRMLMLVDRGVGSDLERGYVYAFKKLIDEGPLAAADAFGVVGRKYPNDVQLKLFEAFLRRSGFDEYGSPMPDQEVAEKTVKDLMQQFPDSRLLMHTWLMLRTENLDMRKDLPMARKLCEMVPDYPPYQHLLGHYEWRSGNFAQAAAAFSRCGELYLHWMKESKLSIVDCPEWIRAEVYRTVALASAGDYESALAAANALATLPIPNDRIESAGARMMYWEAKTLAARLLMRRGAKGDEALAIASLPKPEAVKDIVTRTKVGSFYQGLVIVLEGRKSLAEGDTKRAEELFQLMALHGEKMVEVRVQAGKVGELSPFLRAFECLEVSAAEFRGLLTMKNSGATVSAAYNWISGARDRQKIASRMMPPITLLPMSSRLTDYYLNKNDVKSARETCEEGLLLWPNDLILLEHLQKIATLQKNTEESKKIAAQMEEIKNGTGH
jgi:tetratricopeptide (TPR) repeat protein